jgi:transcriptional regulator with XRE-family HTH domain
MLLDGVGASRLEQSAMVWPSIGAFLKGQRKNIPRDALSLGRYVRLPSRRGKGVTQEELAEAIGASRVWYAMLESGAAVNTSPRLLARLADALVLSAEHRKLLFELALPDLSTSGSSFTLVKHLTSSIFPLQAAARQLWSATTESEILLVVAEAITAIFNDSDLVGAQKRIQPGQWDFPVVIGGNHVQNTITEMFRSLMVGMTVAEIDETMMRGVLTEPGQVGTRPELHRSLSQKRRMDETFTAYGFGDSNFLAGHVKSRKGIEATVFAIYVDGQRDFTDLDRAVLGTLANLASLALSG